jgi:hypothetical protein
MRVSVCDIPKDKFVNVQADILRALMKNGFTEVGTIEIVDIADKFIGYEFEIRM